MATGGGAFMNEKTRAAIAENGLSIWLDADFDLLMRRVRRRPTRPLLQNADPEGVMRKLLADTTPPKEITAISLVPPPISTIILPAAVVTGKCAPIAAAIGSSR